MLTYIRGRITEPGIIRQWLPGATVLPIGQYDVLVWGETRTRAPMPEGLSRRQRLAWNPEWAPGGFMVATIYGHYSWAARSPEGAGWTVSIPEGMPGWVMAYIQGRAPLCRFIPGRGEWGARGPRMAARHGRSERGLDDTPSPEPEADPELCITEEALEALCTAEGVEGFREDGEIKLAVLESLRDWLPAELVPEEVSIPARKRYEMAGRWKIRACGCCGYLRHLNPDEVCGPCEQEARAASRREYEASPVGHIPVDRDKFLAFGPNGEALYFDTRTAAREYGQPFYSGMGGRWEKTI